MRNSRAHGVRGVVDLLQLLEVPRLVVHLNLERVNLEQLGAALRLVVLAALRGVVQIADELGGGGRVIRWAGGW